MNKYIVNILDLKNRAIQSRLLNDSFWVLFGNSLGKGLALAAGIVVARLLGKEIFGEYGMIRNTLVSIAIFSTFGLGFTATKYISENRLNNDEKHFCNFILCQKYYFSSKWHHGNRTFSQC